MSLITSRRTAGILALGASLVIPTALAAPAMAKDSGGHGGAAVTARGTCTSADSWKLKAKHDDGRLEVEFQEDTDRAGQVWHVAITDNRSIACLLGGRTVPKVRTHLTAESSPVG